MHRNTIWRMFLMGFTIATFWFTGIAVDRVRHDKRMSASAQATEISWKAKEFQRELFYPYAHYAFFVGGKVYTGADFYQELPSRNASSVEDQLPQLQKRQWRIWYDPLHPEHSVLQKRFPFKECVTAALFIVLLCYLAGLGLYVGKVHSA